MQACPGPQLRRLKYRCNEGMTEAERRPTGCLPRVLVMKGHCADVRWLAVYFAAGLGISSHDLSPRLVMPTSSSLPVPSCGIGDSSSLGRHLFSVYAVFKAESHTRFQQRKMVNTRTDYTFARNRRKLERTMNQRRDPAVTSTISACSFIEGIPECTEARHCHQGTYSPSRGCSCPGDKTGGRAAVRRNLRTTPRGHRWWPGLTGWLWLGASGPRHSLRRDSSPTPPSCKGREQMVGN
jgi:hypothetical protein